MQTGIGLVDLAAYQSFKNALSTGDPADFEKIVLGGPRTQNGPQGGLAFYLDCLDGSQFAVPPAPALASEAYATELVELYWASLLRDIAFTDYSTNSTATNAAADAGLRGPSECRQSGHARPAVSRRFNDREFIRRRDRRAVPSRSSCSSRPLGSLPITQKYITNKKGVDFMTAPDEFLKVQNGQPTGNSLSAGDVLFLRDGRGLAAYTHDDVLYQAYFMAYLVLNSIGAPLNPGNPYNNSKTQNGFATLGQPDFAATLAAAADEALKAVWYQKWWVHLRHRPESGGGDRSPDPERAWRNH